MEVEPSIVAGAPNACQSLHGFLLTSDLARGFPLRSKATPEDGTALQANGREDKRSGFRS
jgi:hypothetical protein